MGCGGRFENGKPKELGTGDRMGMFRGKQPFREEAGRGAGGGGGVFSGAAGPGKNQRQARGPAAPWPQLVEKVQQKLGFFVYKR